MSREWSSSDVIALYRGWHSLEQQLGGVDVVDFDLTPTTEAMEFSSRSAVLRELERQRRGVVGDDLASQFTRDRLNASIYYLNACLGEQIPFEEYVLQTIGVRPQKFSEVQLVDAYDRVDALLQEMGLKFAPEYKPQYQAQCLIQDKTTVKEKINQQLGKWLTRLGQYIAVPLIDRVTVEFAEVDAYWSNWVSGSVAAGFQLRVNFHPRTSYLKGAPSLLAAHEYCGHLVQAQQWAIGVADGSLDTGYGFTTVHSPEAFMMEGLADVLVYVLVDELELSFEERLSIQLTWHSRLVSNNIHYLINTGHSFREVFAYYRKYSPFMDDIQIESSIRDRSLQPLGRTYQYVYGIALDYFRRLFHGCDDDRKREWLMQLYRQPYTKAQMDQMFGMG